MSRIRGVEVHSGGSGDSAKRWLEEGLTSYGFSKLISSARSGSGKFYDGDGRKYALNYNKEDDSFTIEKRS